MKPIIASQTVFLNAGQTGVVLEGDRTARFLIVRKGQEITEKELSRYPGARELVVGEQAPAPQETEAEEEPEHDKKHKKPHRKVQLED